jgi:hypothetical protein
MNAIVVFCASVAAIFTVAKEKWTEYDCTERVQLFFLTAKEKTTQFIEWTKEIAIPEIQCLYDDCRKLSL